MKIVFVTTMFAWPWGGSEELWARSAVRLAKEGHEISALVPDRPRLSEKVTGLALEGIQIRTYPSPSYVCGKSRYNWSRVTLTSRRISAWLKRTMPDLVVISQGEIAGGFRWAKICRDAGIRYVVIVHCNSELTWFDDDSIQDAVTTYSKAERVFCVSHGNLNQLRLQLGEELENSQIIWNPCNVSAECELTWPTDESRLKLASVARLDPAAKGQDLLLQVLAQPKWRERPIDLSFFGEGLYGHSLQRMANMFQLENVHFRGHVSNVQAIWEQHHLLVLPSRYEGLPLVLVESMWCGRPAVVTDVAGNAELCVDGETGFVALAPTVSEVDRALERAWAARADLQRMGEAARDRVDRLVPKDPIGEFCKLLGSCVSGAIDEKHVAYS